MSLPSSAPPPPPPPSSPPSLPLGEMGGASPDERAPAHGGSQAKTQARKRYTALPVYRWYGTFLTFFTSMTKTTIFKVQMIIV